MKARMIVSIGAAYLFLTKAAGLAMAQADTIKIDSTTLGFTIPNLSVFMTFAIRFLFVIAGLAALFYMLWGAFTWVTSGGDSGQVEKARSKIIHAVIGVIMIVATLSVIVALEQIVFKGNLCFGISCELTLPDLLNKSLPGDIDGDGLGDAADPDRDGDGTCDGANDDANANPGNSPLACKGGPDAFPDDPYRSTVR